MPTPDRMVVVTTAGLSSRDDRRLRTKRYLVMQGIRVVCVILAVTLPVDPIWKIGFIVGSIVLPWLGVVSANAGPTIDRRRANAIVATPVTVETPERVTVEPARVIDAER